MKQLLIFITFFIYSMSFSQVAIGNIDPHPQAQLDVSATQKGVLIPRIRLVSKISPLPISSDPDALPKSLLVFNTNDDTATDLAIGYYYWDNTRWNKIIIQSDLDTAPTTNILESSENTMTSTVNGVGATAPIINTVNTSVNLATAHGYPLTTTVNGIAAPAVDIPEPWNVARETTKASSNTQDIYMNGKVGIGPAPYNNPTAWLDVRGDALINGVTVGRGKENKVSNTAAGFNALVSNTTGHSNTATGYGTLRSNTEGYVNTAVGNDALYSNTTGKYNTANGCDALRYNTTGNYNTANGNYALYNATSSNNTAIGYSALRYNTSGSNNTAIGHEALNRITTGNGNTAIGYGAGPSSSLYSHLSNTTAIGNGATVNANNTIRLGNNAIANIYAAASITTSSDRRWKENIKTIPLGLDFINKVRPVEYIRKNNENKTKEWGVIAQELQQTIEDAGYQDAGVIQEDNTPDKYLSVRYTDLMAPMIKAIQELSKENEDLKKKNDQMENRIDTLEAIIKQMKLK